MSAPTSVLSCRVELVIQNLILHEVSAGRNLLPVLRYPIFRVDCESLQQDESLHYKAVQEQQQRIAIRVVN